MAGRTWSRLLLMPAFLAAAACGDTTGVPTLASVTVAAPATELTVGAELQLSATPRDGAGQALTGHTIVWSSSSSSIASVSTAGLVTGIDAGSATITAESDGRSGSVSLTVVNAPVATVIVSPDSAQVAFGGSLQLSATLQDAAGNTVPGAVEWSSSDSSVVTVSSAGVVSGIAPGVADITASAEARTGTATITVTGAPGMSVSVVPDTATIETGATLQLTTVILDGEGTAVADADIQWSSSDSANAQVSADGLVTAMSQGSAVITASVDGINASAAITIVPVAVASVVVSPDSVVLTVGGSGQFTLSAYSAASVLLSDRSEHWSSTDSSVVIVDSQGLATAVSAGAADIIGTIEGLADTARVSVPVDQIDASSLSAGESMSCALTYAGAAYCWGGLGSPAPQPGGPAPAVFGPHPVPGGHRFVSISAGNTYAVAIDDNGDTWAWGINGIGQLGNGTTVGQSYTTVTPTLVTGGHKFVQVSAGHRHACALTGSGEAYCWGEAGSGEIGHGVAHQNGEPDPVRVNGGHTFSQIVAGGDATYALKADGQAFAWGSNSRGNLGDSTEIMRPEPVPIAGDMRFRTILPQAGVGLGGGVYTWGVGFGDYDVDLMPGTEAFTNVSRYGEHFVAMTDDGTLYAWGTNEKGQLGDGTKIERDLPVPVAGGHGFVVFSAGDDHTIAMTPAGDVYAWGGTPWYLGDATGTEHLVPMAPLPAAIHVDTLEHYGAVTVQAGDSVLVPVWVQAHNSGFRRSTGSTPVTLPYTVTFDGGAAGTTVVTEPLAGNVNTYGAYVRPPVTAPPGTSTLTVSVSAAGVPTVSVDVALTVTPPPPPPPPPGTSFACPTGDTSLPDGYHCMTSDGVHTAGKFSDVELHGTWADADAGVCLVWGANGKGHARYQGGGSVTVTPEGEWGAMINLDGSRFQNERYWMIFTETADPQTRGLAYDSETQSIVNWNFVKGSCPF